MSMSQYANVSISQYAECHAEQHSSNILNNNAMNILKPNTSAANWQIGKLINYYYSRQNTTGSNS